MEIRKDVKKYHRIISLLMALMLMFGTFQAYASNTEVELHGLDQNQTNVVENYIEKITPEVQELFSESKELIDVLVYMKDKANVYEVSKINAIGKTPYARELSSRKAVINQLRDVAEESQKGLMNYLEFQERFGKAEVIESFHIVNIVHVRATQEVIEKIAMMNEVKKVYLNEIIEIEHPIINDLTIESYNDDEIEWNIKQIGAHNVWDKLGIDGTGVVIGIIDSGVDWSHPALKNKYRGYDASTGTVNHEGNWYDPQTGSKSPYDDAQVPHGSHCTGTILGSEEDGTNLIGVAPGAKWIAAKALGSQGGSQVHLLAAAQWMLAPGGDVSKAPSIVNNSWGGSANTSDWFVEIVDAWRAANILPVFAAGNQKTSEPAPWPGSIQNPSSLFTSFAVGATDINNKRGSFSKLGPSLFDSTGTHIKPDIAAPGVNIRSSVIGKYEGGWNGTSMAAPHVTGVAALMKQANPNITVVEMETILKDTAMPLTDGTYPTSPNMGYGYGLLNAFDAVSKVMGTGQGTIEGNVYIEGEDTKEPVIIHEEIDDVFIGEEVLITADISDDIAITEVKLLVKNKNLDDYQEIPMHLKSGTVKAGKYEASISGDLIIDGGVDYKIKVMDFGGNILISPNYRIDIIFGVKPDLYSNNFEKEINGWKLEGEWKWGTPTNMFEPTPNSGTKLIGTNLGSSSVTNGMTSIITSPPIDLRDTELQTARVNFSQWYGLSYTYSAEVQLSINEGNTWTKLGEMTGTKEEWHQVEYDLSEYIGSEVPIYIRLVFTTGASGYSRGWYIDDFKIIGVDNTPPAVPQALKVANKVDGAELTWNKVVDADLSKYIIYRSETTGTNYVKIGETTNNIYLDTTVEGNKTYYYVVSAIDKVGNESSKSNEISIIYEVMLPIFSTNFEDNNGGFTTGVVSGTVNDWAWGTPTAGPTSGKSGTKLWGTNLKGNYSSNQKSYIETPEIILPNDKGAELIFESWMDTWSSVYSGKEGWGNVQISTDDGVTWNTIGNEISGTKKIWETINIDLSIYKGQTIKIRFCFESTSAYILDKGWYIDDVTVLPKQSSANDIPRVEANNIVGLDNQVKSATQGFLPADAIITVLETGRSVRTSLTDGSFSMKHAASEEGKPWTLVVESHGYYTKEIQVNLNENETITKIIELDEISKGNLKGTVLNSDDNTPISNAKIRMLEEPGILDIETDGMGNFAIDNLYEGSYTIRITSNDHYTKTVNVEVIGNQDNSINISMESFIGDENEIGYDDGTHEDGRTFTNAGAGFGIRITPEKYGRLKAAKIYFIGDHPVAVGTDINIGVVKIDDKGNIVHFSNMKTITINRGEWNTIDLLDFNVMTDEDFYIVTQQIYPIENSPRIGIDSSSTANRSYIYNGGLASMNGDYSIAGGIMIRAIMEYPIDEDILEKYPIISKNAKITSTDDEVRVNLDLYNTNSNLEKATIIIQAYDNNNRAYKVVYKEVLLNNKIEKTEFILQSSNYLKGISKVKVYVWDSLDGMKPLSEMIEVK